MNSSPLVRLRTALVRWFDSYAVAPQGDSAEPERVDWVRCIPFVAVHLACLGAIWTGVSPVAVGVCVALYAVRMFAITGFYHRYFSHRAFRAGRGAQMAFAILGNSAGQRGPLWWAAHHRHHHAHSDSREDVHSPRQHGFLWSHMLWFTSRRNFATDQKAVTDLARYPELVFLDRFDALVPVVLAALLFVLGAVLHRVAPGLGTTGPQMLVWGFFVSTVVLFHATCTINSLAHKLGRRRYETGDDSRNSFLLALLTFGEGWHNNHHHYMSSARQGFYWWEIDLTWYLLRGLEALGIVSDLRPVPPKVLDADRVA